MLSDKGSRSIYVDRFWGQVLRKYLRGTQRRPELCFGAFRTYEEPNRPLSLIQPSGAIEETRPIFVCVSCCACHSKREPSPLVCTPPSQFVVIAWSIIVKNVLMPTLVGNKLFIRQYMMDTH